MEARQIPNAITRFRLYASVPLVAIPYYLGWHKAMFVIAIALAATDLLDGFLAKTFDWTSELGRRLDPLADKSLFWPIAIVMLADSNWALSLLVPSIGFLAYDIGGEWLRRKYEQRKIPVIPPNWFARKKTAIQMTSLIAYLGHMAFPVVAALEIGWYSGALYWIAAAFAAVSGYIYYREARSLGLVPIPAFPAIF